MEHPRSRRTRQRRRARLHVSCAALRAGDATPLPPFDENAWGDATNADARALAEHIEELATVRAATLALFRGFTEEQFARSGIASGHHITVRALAYIVAGHERHHVNVLRERYEV